MLVVTASGSGDVCDLEELLGCDSEGDEEICADLACCYVQGGCYHSLGEPHL